MNNKIIVYSTLLLAVIISCSCNNNSRTEINKDDKNDYDTVKSVHEYKNDYKNDTLLMYVEKLSSSGDKEIWEYSYDDKNVNLYSEKKYILKENRQKELYYSKTTEGNKTTAVYLENGDTVTFDEQYFDKNGNVIQNTFRDHFVEEINKKSLFKYDGNNCMMEIISEDYIKGKTVKKTFLYEMKQDTLIKKMYEDGQLFGMAQTVILNDSHKIEFSYSAENELIKKKESKNPDDKTRIEIETSFKKENSIFGSEIIFN